MDMLSKIQNSNNFMYEEFSENSNSYNARIRVFCKDGIFKMVDNIGDEVLYTKYLDTNEPSEISEVSKEYFFNPITRVSLVLASDDSFKSIVTRNILRFMKVEGNYYILTEQSSLTGTYCYYINKETGMIEKWKIGGNTYTSKIIENIVTDEDVQKTENI